MEDYAVFINEERMPILVDVETAEALVGYPFSSRVDSVPIGTRWFHESDEAYIAVERVSLQAEEG
jgi:hypothetical protein